MRIYNLFPLLAGPVSSWDTHFARAADLGFDWIFVNPIQRPGASGSLYSIADHFAFNPLVLDPGDARPAEEQVRAAIAAAHARGLRVMTDLVINHCASDSNLVREHGDWFEWENGALVHPGCDENGTRVVWQDLAKFDYRRSGEGSALEAFVHRMTGWLADLGVDGFRCDAAYQVPRDVWRRLIGRIRSAYAGTVFAAETLGCTPDQTRTTASAGFDFVFNSGKWWDFSSPWLMEQYDLLRDTCPSIGFPESHDTPRLFEETGGNTAAVRQRYLFAALFSAGVLMPMGFEYGARRRLHVVATRPGDAEPPNADFSDFIRATNAVKARYPIFREDCPTHILSNGDPNILVLWKGSVRTGEEALIILNKDTQNNRRYHADRLGRLVQSGAPLTCVSPENPMEFLPEPFDYDLRPGEAIVCVTKRC